MALFKTTPGIRAAQRQAPAQQARADNEREEGEDEGPGDEAGGDVSARGFHTRRRVTIFDM